MNLYQETLNVLEYNEKTFDDVLVICGEDFTISKENFIEVAKVTEYHNGYGGQEVAKDLKILGNGFIMIRGEYDGSEWWDYIDSVSIPTQEITITKLAGGCWDTLAEINDKNNGEE